MDRLVQKYVNKLNRQGLVSADTVLMGGLDDAFVWNRSDSQTSRLETLFSVLGINSFLIAMPSEPYAAIIRYLSQTCGEIIRPADSETRTFLHDIPVAETDDANELARHLKQRKGLVLKDGSIAAFGTVSPEEAFITFSSICFATYVKFMSDCLAAVRTGSIPAAAMQVLQQTLDRMAMPATDAPGLMSGPLNSEEKVYRAMSEAGRHTVAHRLVDSAFGNVSVLWNGVLYISQTGSSLDELESCIDPCPLDGSSSAGITASSEFTAHRRIYEETDADVVLHGHPRFCAILSLDCDDSACGVRGQCHTRCPRERFIGDIPIVPGEVGTGEFGLCNTVPRAMKGHRGVIVFGHGLFTAATSDFQVAMQNLFDIERECMAAFIHRVT